MDFGATGSWEGAGMMFILGGAVLYAIYVLVCLISCSVIARKAGFSGWWSLLILVPTLNLVLLWFFAFSKWPIDNNV